MQGCHDLHLASMEVIGSNWLDAAEQSLLNEEAPVVSENSVPPTSSPLAKTANQKCEDAQLAVVKAARAVEDNLLVAENEVFTGNTGTI